MGSRLKLLFVLFLCILSSCIPHKKTLYFQDNQSTADSTSSSSSDISYKIQSGDLLYIVITSLNKEITEFYNISESMASNPYLTFYLVDDSGKVNIPILGKFDLKGLTLKEAENKIMEKVKLSVNNATIIVKLGSFKITVLGEVSKPGIQTLEGEKGTIFEVLALSGDILGTGDRKHVKVIREQISGKKEMISLDLTDKNIVNSKQIYLRPNDVIYVEPLKAKAVRENVSAFARITGVAGIILVIIRIVNFLN
jgi:polysaccharide biosynthesis/export protein